jgi:hypothetical protein
LGSIGEKSSRKISRNINFEKNNSRVFLSIGRAKGSWPGTGTDARKSGAATMIIKMIKMMSKISRSWGKNAKKKTGVPKYYTNSET